MTTRRKFLSALAASTAFGLPFGWPSSAVAQGGAARTKLHALLVGINSYSGRAGTINPATGQLRLRSIPILKGCINDVRALEAVVRPIAASVRILTDAAATRSAFEAAWRDALGVAARGDTILWTFSGHGGLEPERVKGSEASGYDQTLLFTAFDSERRLDRLLDDEIHEMLVAAQQRGVRVIFVADCCHSGTVTRSIDPRLREEFSYRTVRNYDVSSELTAEIPRSKGPIKELDNVVFFSGAQDHELVPEIQIGGRWHGALSVAFARALSGLATQAADGATTGDQLGTFVHRQVRAITDSGQHPNVRWPTADVRSGLQPGSVLFFCPPAAKLPSPRPAGPVRLRVLGLATDEAAKAARALQNAQLVDSDAQLIWDAATGDCLNATGQKTASGVPVHALQAVVDRVEALQRLVDMVGTTGLDMRLVLPNESIDAPASVASDRVHVEGTLLKIVVRGHTGPYLVIFNIAGTGEIQLLYPLKNIDPMQVPTGGPYVLSGIQVGKPFGADHAVAVASEQPLADFVAEIRTLNASLNPLLAIAAIEATARRQRVQVGLQGIYSALR